MPKRKTARRRKVRPTRFSKAKAKVAKYIKAHHVALLGIIISTLIPFVIYFMASPEPDIRGYVSENPQFKYLGPAMPVEDKSGDCVYYNTEKYKFKNMSFKTGYINNVSFLLNNNNVVPEFKLMDIDRSKFTWGQEKDIEIKYSVILSPDQCSKLRELNDSLRYEIRFYDNVGKLIDKDYNGLPYHILHALKWDVGQQDQTSK